MEPRALTRVGMLGAAILGLVDSVRWMWRPAWDRSQLTPAGRSMLRALADATLDGLLPHDARERAALLNQWGQDFMTYLMRLPTTTQEEFHQLSRLMLSPPGRRWLTGLERDWPSASRQQVTAALQRMRNVTSEPRQQTCHALRDLTNAVYFSNPDRWALLGYGGQFPIRKTP